MSAEIAVLTPLFGHAAYVGAMLASLRAQTFPHWECAVVLDGPDDAAAAAVQAHADADPRITLHVLPERRGVAAARNVAVRATSAPWLLPFDADDLMQPEYLAALLANVQGRAAPPYPVTYAAAACLQPDGRTSVFRYPAFDPTRFTESFQIPNTTLHPRALWQALGGWDEAWTHGAEDWHYWTRAVAGGLIAPLNDGRALWSYREHQGARQSRIGRQHWPTHKRVLDAILRPT